ncbi:transmembrane protein 156-like isoform X2 [Polyodon spathula]|uniref:transmembrane protein 156-like isoform X2 n=1 Tax=Polyodon spathula TaxID=7913 RepID=UPI001B7ED5C4|nr:transmembrane protein 156-like isoform X2 [Polyodon spathula]
MTKAALMKLFTAILIVFIICLPEFFNTFEGNTHKVLLYCTSICSPPHDSQQITLLNMSLPWVLQEERSFLKLFTNDSIYSSDAGRRFCEHALNRTESTSGWFVCGSNNDVDEVYQNISSSGSEVKTYLEIAGTVQNVLISQYLNVSLRHSSGTGQKTFFFLMEAHTPNVSEPSTVNYSYNISLISTYSERAHLDEKASDMNFTIQWTTNAKDGSCSGFQLRVIWLTLILIVMLLVITAVLFMLLLKNQRWHVCNRRRHTSETNIAVYNSFQYPLYENVMPEHSAAYQNTPATYINIPVDTAPSSGQCRLPPIPEIMCQAPK